MSLLRPRFSAVFAAWLVGGGGLTVMAQGIPSSGRAIQFSDPKVELVTSNLNQAASAKKSSLRNLDDQFKTSLNILDSADAASTAGMPMPLLRTPTLSPRAIQQLMDKKKEQSQWIFGTPEELEAQRLSAERMFGVTEYDESGTEKTSQTPLQRYWDRSERERLGQTNQHGLEVSTDRTDQEIKDQARIMFGTLNLKGESGLNNQSAPTKSSLTPTYANSLFPEASSLRSSSELFSLPAPAFSSQKNDAAANRLSEFKKQLFDTKPVSPGVASSFGSAASSFSRSTSVGDYGAPASTWRPSSTMAPVSSFNALQGSSLTKPLGGYPASSLNPAPPPLVQTPKSATPPAGFQVPKRSF